MATPSTIVSRLDAGSKVKIKVDGKEMEVTVSARYDAYGVLPDEAKAAIAEQVAAGTVLVDENVLVKVGDEYVVYTQYTAKTVDAAAVLVGGAQDLVLDNKGEPKSGEPSVTSAFNYGNDLNAKRFVRQQHEKKVKGPEKTVNATIKNLMALGYSQAEAEALAKAKLPTA